MSPGLPTVTAVVITRDRPQLLADALASIAHQSLRPVEARIADDGESDVSGALASLGPIEARVVRSGAAGPAAARNRAARGARGDALAFLDDDDRWLPGHLEGLAASLADPAAAFAYCDCAIVREALEPGGARSELGRRVIARDWDEALMRRDDYIPPSAWMVRRSLFERLGGFDESFRFSEDWDFLMRAAVHTTPRRVPAVSAEIRLRASGNASADLGEERIDCLRRLAARHGLPPIEPKTFWEVAEAVATARTHSEGGR